MAFVARTERGAELRLDGTAELGGDEAYLRPMEALLASLASCSGVDVAMILGKQKEPVEGLEIRIHGNRANTVPKVFESIDIEFRIAGGVAENKAQRAVALSMEKYCSVARTLSENVKVTYKTVLVGAGAQPH